MITEDYCSFEVAKLLKEKEFDEKTLSYYEDNVLCHGDWFEWNRSPLGHIAAPTLQMVMKWLRKVHNIAINIGWGEVFEDKFQWWCIILSLKDGSILRESEYYATYEDAVEAALKYCLENLI